MNSTADIKNALKRVGKLLSNLLEQVFMADTGFYPVEKGKPQKTREPENLNIYGRLL